MFIQCNIFNNSSSYFYAQIVHLVNSGAQTDSVFQHTTDVIACMIAKTAVMKLTAVSLEKEYINHALYVYVIYTFIESLYAIVSSKRDIAQYVQ